MTQELGTLERVDLRTVWICVPPRHAPWQAQHDALPTRGAACRPIITPLLASDLAPQANPSAQEAAE